MPFQLAIDRGNSRTKVSIAEENGPIAFFSVLHEDDLDYELEHIFREYTIERCIVSNVRETKAQLKLPITCISLSHLLKLPFTNAYGTPETVGHDRLANMAAASVLYPNDNVLVIDCGSCITYSLLISNSFLGGSISPGVQMRFNALHEFTGQLPQLETIGRLPDILGKTTTDSIHSGVEFAIVAETRGMIDAYLKEFGPLKVVLTGGDYSFFEKYLKSPTFALDQLTQIGLHEILRINDV
jgi:type III pantothenate kinase